MERGLRFFWLKNYKVKDYFWMDGLFKGLLEKEVKFKNQWLKTPFLYCEDTGSKPVGQKRFIALFLDCCKNQLALKDIYHFTKQGRPYIKGLVVRNSDQKHTSSPTILPENKLA